MHTDRVAPARVRYRRELITTGMGQPNVGEAKTNSEQALVRAAEGMS